MTCARASPPRQGAQQGHGANTYHLTIGALGAQLRWQVLLLGPFLALPSPREKAGNTSRGAGANLGA
eukprot:scaffold247594_cov39-Tisochrysis_lutea.AAC.1